MTGRPSTMPALLAAFTGPMTQAELRAASGLSQASVSRHLAALMDEEPRRAYIGAWLSGPTTGSPPVAVYHPGPGEDLPCTIRAMTEAERTRRYRTRQRKTGEWEDRLAAQRARHWATRPVSRDPMILAFFGAPAT